jgi:hypothetical protein
MLLGVYSPILAKCLIGHWVFGISPYNVLIKRYWGVMVVYLHLRDLVRYREGISLVLGVITPLLGIFSASVTSYALFSCSITDNVKYRLAQNIPKCIGVHIMCIGAVLWNTVGGVA